jgi:hypothetical protein
MVGGSCATSRRSANPGGARGSRTGSHGSPGAEPPPAPPPPPIGKSPASCSWCARDRMADVHPVRSALQARRRSAVAPRPVKPRGSTSVTQRQVGTRTTPHRPSRSRQARGDRRALRRAMFRWGVAFGAANELPPEAKVSLICTRTPPRTASKTCDRNTITRSSTPTR